MSEPATFDISQFAGTVSEYTDHLLSDYIADVRRRRPEFTTKEINDPIWGTITLSPFEVCVLDSPLLQRLRYIRQLGVVHWVYPTAGHSRLEHTLGVVHQTQRLVSAINERSSAATKNPLPLIDPNWAALLRLAALTHDVGHLAFSHISERALECRVDIGNIVRAFSDEKNVEQKHLSEIIAFYVVRSRAFNEFLRTYSNVYGPLISLNQKPEENLDEVITRVSDALVGLPILDDVPILQELISGPFDADKLDYLVRDAQLAGIPSIVDISRLIQKIHVQAIPLSSMPPRIAAKVKERPLYHLFGLKWSAKSTLDELHLARALLYSKVYRHQKVSAAEAMIEASVHLIAKALSSRELIETCLRLTDDLFLLLGERGASMLPVECPALAKCTGTQADLAGKIISRLRRRMLFVRGFAIPSRFPHDPLAGDPAQKDGFRQLVNDLSNPEKLMTFKDGIVSEVAKLIHLIEPSLLGTFPISTLSSYVWIVPPNRPTGGAEIGRALLFPSEAPPVPYGDGIMNTEAWSKAYHVGAPDGYVYCPSEIADVVFIAAEKVLRMQYNVRAPEAAVDLSKRKWQAIISIKRKLVSSDFYDGCPIDLRAEPDRLSMADIGPRIETVVRRLASFHPPMIATARTQTQDADRHSIRRWLSQFRDPSSIDCALRMLQNIRVLGRPEVVEALKSFVKVHPEFEMSLVCGLGSPKDSGGIASYFSQDLGGMLVEEVVALDDAVRRGGSNSIIFVDDFSSSGRQFSDIVGWWFGIDKLKIGLGEKRDKLSPEANQYLKNRKVGFVFVAAWDEGMKLARDVVIPEAQLDAVVYAYLRETDIPFAFENVLVDVPDEQRRAFEKRCAEIGKAIRLSKGETAEKAEMRALGYGNRAMLLASTVNVPSQTLTCIWDHGQYDGAEWIPLLPRRRKI
jgi:HD superfamily phosphohydrolase